MLTLSLHGVVVADVIVLLVIEVVSLPLPPLPPPWVAFTPVVDSSPDAGVLTGVVAAAVVMVVASIVVVSLVLVAVVAVTSVVLPVSVTCVDCDVLLA